MSPYSKTQQIRTRLFGDLSSANGLGKIYKQIVINSTDKHNALRRECTFKIEIVLEIGVAGVNIYFKITVLTLSVVLARLAQSVRPWRMIINFYQ